MSNLAATLGEETLNRLAQLAGGTRLYVPKYPGKPPGGGRNGLQKLGRLVGEDLAILLVFHFGDSTIYVPRLGSRYSNAPIDSKRVARLAKRHNAPAIARALGCSERTVFKHLARTRTGSKPKTRKAKGKDGP